MGHPFENFLKGLWQQAEHSHLWFPFWLVSVVDAPLFTPTWRLDGADFSPNASRQRLAGGGGGASSSMLRVTLQEVWMAEDVVQSSLSPSGETLRVDAVLELSPSTPARSDAAT